MSCGRIEWSMSTIVASGSTLRIAPFIAPMYSPAPKSVVNVTIGCIRFDPSVEAPQAFFDPREVLLATRDFGIRLRGTRFAVFQLLLPSREGRLGRLQRDPLGPDSIAFRGELDEAFLEVRALCRDRLQFSLSVRFGSRHPLLRGGFAVFDLVDSMLKGPPPLSGGPPPFL